jgi:hypothetical protein
MELRQQQRCKFGLGPDRLLISLLVYSTLHFLIIICTGRTQQQISALRKCRPLPVILNPHYMYFLQISNLDSVRKVILDSIAGVQKQQFNPVDYINKVDSFYNNAWTKLAIIFGLVGVIVPLIINYLQFRRIDSEKEVIKANVKAELQNEIDEYLKSEVSRIQHASEGVSYQIQSDIWFDKAKYKEAFGGTVNAMTCYLIGEDYNNFSNALEDLYIRFTKVKKTDIASISEEYGEYYDINSLISKMKSSDDQKYTCHLQKIKSALNVLT